MSAEGVEKTVEAYLTKQSSHWRATIGEVHTFLDYVGNAPPLMGGIQCGGVTFGGSPPADAPVGFAEQVAGGRGAGGSSDTAEEEPPAAGGTSLSTGTASRGIPCALGGAASTKDGAVPSGRTLRAAAADNVRIAAMPGATAFMSNLSKCIAESTCRFDEKQKTKRIACLTRLAQAQPNHTDGINMLNVLVDGAGPSLASGATGGRGAGESDLGSGVGGSGPGDGAGGSGLGDGIGGLGSGDGPGGSQ